jgi:hypothetical protein
MEEIDMAVPASGGWQQSEPATPDAGYGTPGRPIKSSSLDGRKIAAEVGEAVRMRRRLAFTARQRAKRLSDFDSTIRLVVKRIAAEASSQVQDRRIRGELRIGIYGAVLAMIGSLVEDQMRERLRARSKLKWCLGIVLATCCALIAALIAARLLIIP